MAMILPVGPDPGKRKLLDEVRDAIRRKHFSIRTEEAYTAWHVKALLTCQG